MTNVKIQSANQIAMTNVPKNPDASKQYSAKRPTQFWALSSAVDWHLGFGIDLTFEPWSPLAPPKAGKL
jgi:hypothetical protein